MNEIIALSERTLDATAQMALRYLAVFPAQPATFSYDAAVSVVATIEGIVTLDVAEIILDRLIDNGLLEIQHDRYSLHQTIAEYARQTGRPEAASRAMFAFFADYVSKHQQHFDALGVEEENIHQALLYATTMTQSDWNSPEQLGPVILALFNWWENRGNYATARRFVEAQLSSDMAVTQPTPDEDKLTTLLPALLLRMGQLVSKQGDFDLARRHFERGLALTQTARNKTLTADLLQHLAVACQDIGDYTQAHTHFAAAMQLARDNHDPKLLSGVLLRHGGLWEQIGEYAKAEVCFREGLNVSKQSGDEYHQAGHRICLGVLAAKRGQMLRAAVEPSVPEWHEASRRLRLV